MTDLIIKPWIGENYGTSTLFPGSRILILGESFHGELKKDKPPEENAVWLTKRYFNDEFRDNTKRQFWIRTNNLFMNVKTSSLAKNGAKEFWNAVAFNNYIRHTTLPEPREHVRGEFWTTANEMFPSLLDETKPTFIAVMGVRVWDHLLKNGPEKGCKIPEAPKRSQQTRIFTHAAGKALAFRVQHPSSGLSYKEWHPSLMKAIEESKKL